MINADEHECWACKHHATGKCDTWCDASESFEFREDVKNAKTAFDVEAVVKEFEEAVFPMINRSKAIEIVRKGGAK